jgi:hypothetical protein
MQPNAPSIRDALGGGPPAPIQRRVCFYLIQATPIVNTMEMRPDVLDGEDVFLSSGPSSDGDWVWRADLAHYVPKYNIGIPADFIEHAQAHLWNPGTLTAEQAARCAAAARSDRLFGLPADRD